VQSSPILFANDQVSFKITESFPFCDDFGTFVNQHPVRNDSAGVFRVATLALTAEMMEFPVQELDAPLDSIVYVLTVPY